MCLIADAISDGFKGDCDPDFSLMALAIFFRYCSVNITFVAIVVTLYGVFSVGALFLFYTKIKVTSEGRYLSILSHLSAGQIPDKYIEKFSSLYSNFEI
jgi:hypothetical protein